MRDVRELARLAHDLRRTVLEMAWAAGSGHLGGSFSCAEILAVLYGRFLNVDPADPHRRDRDIFILSKGHAAPALYYMLARRGFFEPEKLLTLRKKGSILQGHPDMHKVPGVEISTGSLGMGISNGIGFCLGNRLNGVGITVYVLCGDGELNEGQCWEAFNTAAKFALDNLVVIVDRNHVQLDGTVEEIVPLPNLPARLEAFGWQVYECDGHNVEDLARVIARAKADRGKPKIVLSETVKGKGVSFMEGQAAWHGKPLSEDEYRRARKELEEAVA